MQTSRDAIREECLRELGVCLAEHRRRYPLGNEEDIVKFVFQGLLGAGHLIASEHSAREGLKSELAGLEADGREPLLQDEPAGGAGPGNLGGGNRDAAVPISREGGEPFFPAGCIRLLHVPSGRGSGKDEGGFRENYG